MNEVTGENNTVIDPSTGEKKEYRHLMTDPATKAIWEPAMTIELDRLLNKKMIRFIRKYEVP